MGRTHLRQDGWGGPEDWDGTLAWGTCRAGLHYLQPGKKGAWSQKPWLAWTHAVSA